MRDGMVKDVSKASHNIRITSILHRVGICFFIGGGKADFLKLSKFKIIIHEQNAVMGKTNRLLSYLTKNIALTFKNTKYARSYSTFTGIPVRRKKNVK